MHGRALQNAASLVGAAFTGGSPPGGPSAPAASTWRSKLSYPVAVRFLTRLLFAIVALQLAFGLQLASAHAAYAPSGMHASSDACALHKAPSKPADKHDCCNFSGNHCQCSGLAFAVDVVAARASPVVPRVSVAIVSSPANAPPDSLFRPPIAS